MKKDYGTKIRKNADQPKKNEQKASKFVNKKAEVTPIVHTVLDKEISGQKSLNKKASNSFKVLNIVEEGYNPNNKNSYKCHIPIKMIDEGLKLKVKGYDLEQNFLSTIEWNTEQLIRLLKGDLFLLIRKDIRKFYPIIIRYYESVVRFYTLVDKLGKDLDKIASKYEEAFCEFGFDSYVHNSFMSHDHYDKDTDKLIELTDKIRNAKADIDRMVRTEIVLTPMEIVFEYEFNGEENIPDSVKEDSIRDPI